MMPPTSIDGTDITGATIDGQDVEEITVDGQTVFTAEPDLPDSAIHYWQMDEGSGTTAGDSIGNADGSINGPTWVSGTWVGGFALDGDGTNDFVETTTLGNWGSQMSNGWGIALTIETTDTDSRFLGTRESNNNSLLIQTGDAYGGINDKISMSLVGPSNFLTINSSSDVTDGSKHRVVFTGSNLNPSNVTMYFDNTDETNVAANGTPSIGNFSDPIRWFRWNRSDKNFARNPLDGILDEIIVFDDEVTAQEVDDDYNRQPWS